MRAIKYAAPRTIEDAVAILDEHRDKARIFAGGTDLIAQVREYLRDVEVFVDAKHVLELMDLRISESGEMTLGAAVPCYQICGNPRVAELFPGFIDAASIIGGTAIQGRASVGGNLCNSGPAADSTPSLIVHSVQCIIAGPKGRRTVPVESFCTAPGRNVLAANELLVALKFPAPRSHSGAHYLRFTPRNEMDIAVVGAGAYVELNGNAIKSARIALGAVAPTPLFVSEAGEALVGKTAEETSYDLAAAIGRDAASPIDDMRGTDDFRRHLCGVLIKRALRGAVARAKGGRINAH